MTKFSDVSERVARLLREGFTVEAAAQDAGVAPTTVRSWIRRGKRDPDSAYGRWLASFDGAIEAYDVTSTKLLKMQLDELEQAEKQDRMTVEEAERHLEAAVRKGSVGALKLWFERHDRDGQTDDPFAEFDARSS